MTDTYNFDKVDKKGEISPEEKVTDEKLRREMLDKDFGIPSDQSLEDDK